MCENIKKSVTTYISHLGQLEGTAPIVETPTDLNQKF